jgi:hypothetical protein
VPSIARRQPSAILLAAQHPLQRVRYREIEPESFTAAANAGSERTWMRGSWACS